MRKTELALISIVCIGILGGFLLTTSVRPHPATLTIDSMVLSQGGIGSIIDLTVSQYVGGEWVTRGVVEDDGFSITVQPDQPTNLTMKVQIFSPYAESVPQSLTNTRVYISISDEIVNALMTGKSAYASGEGYIVTHSYYWDDGPEDGIDYPTTFDYQVYY